MSLKVNPRLLQNLRVIRFWVNGLGFDPLATLRAIQGIPRYAVDLRTLLKQRKGHARQWPLTLGAPCFSDWSQQGGVASGHYFHQDLLVAQRIFSRSPERHVDVGSRVDGFVAHVASFRKVEILDIRRVSVDVRNITFRQCDVMAMPDDLIDYCDSVSCLHALEHFGLGRYADPVRFDGYQVGFRNLVKLLRPGGVLYLSVPIGSQRIEFNGHRIFSVATILDLARPHLQLEDFHYVDDLGELHMSAPLSAKAMTDSFGLSYGCGIFEFVKRQVEDAHAG